MLNTLFIISILVGIAFVIHIIQKYKKDRATRAKRDEHLKWIDSRLEEMAVNNPKMFVEKSDVSMSDDIRILWGYPPKQEVVMEEIMSGNEVLSGWDYAVHIHEATEQYLGTSQFNRLENMFTSIPGVDECHQEDREVFLVRTKRLSHDDIKKLFWEQFLLVAEAAFNKKR